MSPISMLRSASSYLSARPLLREGEAIRVLHVLPRVLAGGVERRRVILANRLGPEFEQRLACLSGRGPLYEELLSRGLDVYVSPDASIRSPRTHLDLHRIVRSWRPHILHGAIFEGMVWGGLTGLLQRVPVVLLEETSHPDRNAPDGFRRSRKALFLLQQIALRTAGVVAVAPEIGVFLRERQGLPHEKVHVVMNGVERFELASSEEALTERRRLGFPDGAFVVGGAARLLDPHKRFSDLIRAVKILREKHDVRALIIGQGRDRQMLEDLARELGVGDAVVFTGRREDRGLFLRMMDAFVLSSAIEAAPLGLMEAMLAGRPCVATTVGGVPDIAEDGVTALLVPPLHPERIASAIERLVEDVTLRETVARNAKEAASRRFTAERYAQDVAALYRRQLTAAGVFPRSP